MTYEGEQWLTYPTTFTTCAYPVANSNQSYNAAAWAGTYDNSLTGTYTKFSGHYQEKANLICMGY